MILNQVQDSANLIFYIFSLQIQDDEGGGVQGGISLEAGVVPRGDGVELCLDGIGDVQRIYEI